MASFKPSRCVQMWDPKAQPWKVQNLADACGIDMSGKLASKNRQILMALWEFGLSADDDLYEKLESMFQMTNPEMREHMPTCIAGRYRPDMITNYIAVCVDPSGTEEPRERAWLTCSSTSSNCARRTRQDVLVPCEAVDPARSASELGLHGYWQGRFPPFICRLFPSPSVSRLLSSLAYSLHSQAVLVHQLTLLYHARPPD
ncbi:hypothetical protein BJ166DRAFT_130462 [Pestalotiopsis sp. NC0098]|nr:hypothetical protein BJ166DRAFT_130462 [Pestalotiopsis sp. NC0098]